MWDFLPNTLKKGDWVGIITRDRINFLPIEKIDGRGTITLVDKTRWNRFTGLKWGTQTEHIRRNTPIFYLQVPGTTPYLVTKEVGLKRVKDIAEY
jgi:hypothetical protein